MYYCILRSITKFSAFSVLYIYILYEILKFGNFIDVKFERFITQFLLEVFASYYFFFECFCICRVLQIESQLLNICHGPVLRLNAVVDYLHFTFIFNLQYVF